MDEDLAEDRFYDRCPCILITGKGFPSLDMRALVHYLHQELGLPVFRFATQIHLVWVLCTHTKMQGQQWV